jgi:hypothetical protein
MARVVRTGGRIVAVEPDYGTLSIEGADRDLTRTLLESRRAHFRSPRIGAELPSIFRANGLADVLTRLAPQVTGNLDLATESWLRRKYVLPAVAAGVATPEDGARWLSDLGTAAAAGRFRHAVFVYLVYGRMIGAAEERATSSE